MHADTDTANNVEEIMGKTLNNTFAVSIFGPFVGLEFRGGVGGGACLGLWFSMFLVLAKSPLTTHPVQDSSLFKAPFMYKNAVLFNIIPIVKYMISSLTTWGAKKHFHLDSYSLLLHNN